jgi:hypothetical protein
MKHAVNYTGFPLKERLQISVQHPTNHISVQRQAEHDNLKYVQITLESEQWDALHVLM